jgi:pyrimidine operon attenuation protein/uracil phosphoribosyltransferase
MEKNWIEKIKEAVRVAMNKGLNIQRGTGGFPYTISIKDPQKNQIYIYIFKEGISISTSNGYVRIDHSITEREELEIQALQLSIKEYNGDMAISEFEEFISDKKEEITDINNLDDDD